jgi:hypothetical protein
LVQALLPLRRAEAVPAGMQLGCLLLQLLHLGPGICLRGTRCHHCVVARTAAAIALNLMAPSPLRPLSGFLFKPVEPPGCRAPLAQSSRISCETLALVGRGIATIA